MPAQEERQADEQDAEERGEEPGGVIAIAEEDEGCRCAKVLKRAVVGGVVDVLHHAVLGDVPGEFYVDTFVMVDRAFAQGPETQARGERHQGQECAGLPVLFGEIRGLSAAGLTFAPEVT